MMFFLLGLSACLVNHELYEERRLALTDADQDGFVAEVDCHDGDPTIHPDASEVCNGLDDDCDGDVDEDAADVALLYRDADGDGFGDTSEAAEACPGQGWAEVAGDCDDGDADVHPDAAEEPYDGVDNDCVDGDAADLDGDGHDAVAAGGGDCDDGDATVHPDAAETWENGATDNDCDGDYGAATLEYGAAAWTGEAAGDNAGRRITALGDVSGDGLAEFVVAAPFHGSAHDDGGAVYIVSGGEPGPLAEEGVIDAGGASWYLGSALAGGEDLDDDGVADLLVTATGWDEGRGAAWLVSGADLPGEGERVDLEDVAAWRVEGTEAGTFLGSSVAMLGDVDGDGVGDVGVGVPFAEVGEVSDAGCVRVWSGVAMVGGVADDATWDVCGFYDGQLMANVVTGAGDQDGDGYDDFMASGVGTIAAVFHGGAEEPGWDEGLMAQVWEASALGRAEPLMVGDIDGDGARDLAIIVENADVHFFTQIASHPTRDHEAASAAVSMEGSPVYVFDLTDLGDLDGDGRDDTLIQPQSDLTESRSAMTVAFGAALSAGARIPVDDLALRAVSTRDLGAYGYRVARSDDIDGDGGMDLVVAGYADREVGEGAGGVVLISVPE